MRGGEGGAGVRQYLFDNAWQQASERLALLAASWDTNSIRHLDALPIAEGWRCLEIGAGSGTIARWLCGRVGSAGHVVATDIDTRFLGMVDHPNLEIREHDIAYDELADGEFDLVCARLVLSHLPKRGEALVRMVAAVKPGGWILVEDFAHRTFLCEALSEPIADAVRERLVGGFLELATRRGIDHAYGEKLFGLLAAAGLENVQASGAVVIDRGGLSQSRLFSLGLTQLREPVVAAGLLANDEVDAALALLNDPRFTIMSPLMVSACGQRPRL